MAQCEADKSSATLLGNSIGRQLDIILMIQIVLKMTDLVAWSWWFTLWPLLVQAGLTLLVLVALGIAKAVEK